MPHGLLSSPGYLRWRIIFGSIGERYFKSTQTHKQIKESQKAVVYTMQLQCIGVNTNVRIAPRVRTYFTFNREVIYQCLVPTLLQRSPRGLSSVRPPSRGPGHPLPRPVGQPRSPAGRTGFSGHTSHSQPSGEHNV